MPKQRRRKPAPVPEPPPARAATVVTTAEDAAALADHLLHPGRSTPVVVVTVAAGATAPYADVERLSAELAGLAEVFVLATGAQTWALAARLPARTEVYGGAARAYPTTTDWQQDPGRAPLRFAFGLSDRERVTETVLSDAMAMGFAQGLQQAPTTSPSWEASGVVLGNAGGRALVQLEPRTPMPALIWPELTAPGLGAEQLFVTGMRVRGTYHPEQRRLDVVGLARPPVEALVPYVPGSVVLARVRHVERELCVAEIYPDVQAPVDVASLLDGDDAADLRTVLSGGEVILVTVTGWQDDEPVLALAGETATPLEAPSVLAGGPPWLVPAAVSTVADGEPGPPAEPVDNARFAIPDSQHPAVAALQAERDQLLLEVRRSGQRLEATRRALDSSRTEVRRYRERSTTAERALRAAEQRLAGRTLVSDQPLFSDREEQLRFDVEVTWAYRTTPTEKVELPLRSWRVGDHFFASWEAVEGISREKVVDVVVEVLIGRAEHSAGRDVHQLRTGAGGDDPYVSRTDGATCWRVALQQGTPAARRLHYWRLNDGSVELSSIRLHADTSP